MTPKLIALDLDGTLLAERGRLSARNAAAVRATAAAGHHVVIATGRPLHMVVDLADELGTAVSHVVGTNGSMIGTFPDCALIRLMGFAFAAAVDAVDTMRSRLPGVRFAMATDAGFAHEVGFAERMPAAVDGDPVDDVLAIGGTEVHKLFAFHDAMSIDALLRAVPESLPPGLTANHMGASAIDIGPAEVDKCAGLRWVCELLGVDAVDVIAFGDEWNDITMLRWAGRGIAMANADERVRAAADEITLANVDDGVAAVLEALIG